jgi:hypothetical protein
MILPNQKSFDEKCLFQADVVPEFAKKWQQQDEPMADFHIGLRQIIRASQRR